MFRYTPLDYALMGEHYEVAQYMIEQGGLSITGIQDIAALKIQASIHPDCCWNRLNYISRCSLYHMWRYSDEI